MDNVKASKTSLSDLTLDDFSDGESTPSTTLPPSLGPSLVSGHQRSRRSRRRMERRRAPTTPYQRASKRTIRRRIQRGQFKPYDFTRESDDYSHNDRHFDFESNLESSDRQGWTHMNKGRKVPRGWHKHVDYRSVRTRRSNDTVADDQVVGTYVHNYHVPRGAQLQEICYTMDLFLDNTFTSDASGIALLQLSNNPSFCSNWSNLAAPFEQYRVASFSWTYEPVRTFGTAVFAPVASCIDRDDSTALTGYSAAARYSSYELAPGQAPIHRYARASGINELGFIPCTTPVADLWIKAYSSGNSVSSTLGRYVAKYRVIFKGLGLT